jgi:hypothetical protein
MIDLSKLVFWTRNNMHFVVEENSVVREASRFAPRFAVPHRKSKAGRFAYHGAVEAELEPYPSGASSGDLNDQGSGIISA